ncbi:YheC/YheD family protein [Paenibacillus sp. GCM10023252]|uniref:YheC/YheD family protein n=1 Tax=Paenibacillus sp. GCM10023252 TaxID=3252649 RepID=UPI003610C686
MKTSRKKAALPNRARDKWTKTKVMVRSKLLKDATPETQPLTKDGLRRMLGKYGMVYVKPGYGSQGRGVTRVMKQSAGIGRRAGYVYQVGERALSFSSFEGLYQSLSKTTRKESHIVQRGIHLLKHRGRPFDIRVMVQQRPRGGWEVTGMIGRAAHPRKIVTNGSQGGTIYEVRQLLKDHAAPAKRAALQGKMNRLGLATIRQLHAAYPGIREIGLDLAIDRRLKPWILEANTKPDPCPFAIIRDQTMLRRIVRYGRAYGRHYTLRCVKAKRGV